MSIDDNKLRKFQEALKNALQEATDGLTREEFLAAFKAVTDYIAQIDARNIKEFQGIQEALSTLSQQVKDDTDADLTTVKAQIADTLQKQIDAVQNKLAAVKDGEDGKDSEVPGPPGKPGKKGDPGEPGKDGSPDSSEAVRDKLESLTDDARLSSSAIKGLDDSLGKLDKKASRIQTPAKAYMIYNADCSSQCDGNTKTFNVGGTHKGIVGVYSTQAPIIYRPIIDYTVTARGFTLTAGVNAPQTGQTLVCQFLK